LSLTYAQLQSGEETSLGPETTFKNLDIWAELQMAPKFNVDGLSLVNHQEGSKCLHKANSPQLQKAVAIQSTGSCYH